MCFVDDNGIVSGWELTDFRYGKDIRLYGAKDMMVDKWKHFTDIMTGHWKIMFNKQLPLSLLMMVTDVIRDFGSYFYLGILAITGKITIGIATQMFTAAGTFYNSMRSLVVNFQDLSKRANYANEYVKFMDYPAAIQKGHKHVTPGPHTFEFKDVSFTYPGADVEVLKNINLTLTPGEKGKNSPGAIKITKDGKWIVTSCSCLGCCCLAPAITINGEVYGKLKVEDVDKILDSFAD